MWFGGFIFVRDKDVKAYAPADGSKVIKVHNFLLTVGLVLFNLQLFQIMLDDP